MPIWIIVGKGEMLIGMTIGGGRKANWKWERCLYGRRWGCILGRCRDGGEGGGLVSMPIRGRGMLQMMPIWLPIQGEGVPRGMRIRRGYL